MTDPFDLQRFLDAQTPSLTKSVFIDQAFTPMRQSSDD
jgi:hypothetical protein